MYKQVRLAIVSFHNSNSLLYSKSNFDSDEREQQKYTATNAATRNRKWDDTRNSAHQHIHHNVSRILAVSATELFLQLNLLVTKCFIKMVNYVVKDWVKKHEVCLETTLTCTYVK